MHFSFSVYLRTFNHRFKRVVACLAATLFRLLHPISLSKVKPVLTNQEQRIV